MSATYDPNQAPVVPEYLDGATVEHLRGIEEHAAQVIVETNSQRLPRLRYWWYRTLWFFNLGNLRMISAALSSHRRAVQRERDERRMLKMLEPEAITYMKLMQDALARMGFNHLEVDPSTRRKKFTQKVRFMKPLVLTESRFYYRIHTASTGLFGSRSMLPYKTKASDLIDEKTVFQLATVTNRRVRVQQYPGLGMWIELARTQDLAGLPKLVKFDHVLYQVQPGKQEFVLGVSENRALEIVSLRKVPHALIGGSTGGGKSVFLNQVLCSLIRLNTPAELKIAIIDLKDVEFFDYVKYDPNTGEFLPGQSIPHLIGPIISEQADAVNALKQVFALIKERYALLKGKARNLDEYNRNRVPENRLPRLLIIIDEISELFVDKRWQAETEPILLRIVQLGRAAGVHVFAATQRPSKEILPTNVQAQLDLKMSFRMPRDYDSLTILGTNDAARLENVPGRAVYKLGPRTVQVQPPLIERPKIVESIAIAMDMQPHDLALPPLAAAEEVLAGSTPAIDYENGLIRMLNENGGKLDIHSLMDVLGLTQGQATIFQSRVDGVTFNHAGEKYRVRHVGRTLRVRPDKQKERERL